MDRNLLVRDTLAFLRDYGAKRIHSSLFDARRCLPPYVVLDFGRRGLLGLGVAARYGGLGLTWRERIAVAEQIAALDLSLALFVGIHNELGIGPILNFGTPRLHEELLGDLASGRMLGGLAITEEGAGSNPRALTSTVERTSAGTWKINAAKQWIGNGTWAGVLNVFARRQGGERPNIMGFAVRTDLPGMRLGAEAMTMGMRSVVQSEVALQDVEVASHCLLGEVDDDMTVAETSFRLARLGLAMAASGSIKRCLQLTLRYAGRRQISTGLLAEHPLLRLSVTRAVSCLQVLRYLLEDMTMRLDTAKPVPAELYFVCKVLAPEYLHEVADGTVQWLGGRGYIESNEAPRILRDARLFRIMEGPTETMCSHLGAMWRHQKDLRNYLAAHPLGKDVLVEMEEACEAVWRTPRKENLSVGQYTHARNGAIGNIVAQGVGRGLVETNPCADYVRRWARQRFEDAIVAARRVMAGTSISLAAMELELCADIGDIEQSLPGEAWQSDPHLRRHVSS